MTVTDLSERTTIIDLIRHGEPEGGRAYRGHGIDDPLSNMGWKQMWNAVGDVAVWDHIITSPLLRCSEFAQALAKRHGLPVKIEENLKEIGFGAWEGRTPDQIKAEYPDEYKDFYRDPVNQRPSGAEDLEEFYSRVSTVFESVCSDHSGKHVLMVAHAGVLRAIITHVLQAPLATMYQVKVDNAGITRIRSSNSFNQLISHNSVLSGQK